MSINPKKESIMLHKQVVLCYLLVLNIDDLKQTNLQLGNHTKEFKEALKTVQIEAEKMLKVSFDINSISKSTYIQELATKVETVIKKNYQKK